MMNNKKGSLFVVSGPSGAGKGTVCKALLLSHPEFSISVSATTREKREGEEEGISYYYISREEFKKRADEGGFLEWAEFCGNYYGTPKAAIEEKLAMGIDVILEIEVNGALQVKKIYPEAILCFVVPPSFEVLKDRLVGRGTEDEDVIAERLKKSVWEYSLIDNYDYIILNDDVNKAVERFITVAESAGMRTKNNEFYTEKFKSDAKAALGL